ncbi:MAG: hypothetical protein WAX07_07865 [Candidatus Altiarchaeia archaeon]
MSLKEFIKQVYGDIHGSLTRPWENAKRLKQSAGFDYGLKVMLLSSVFYFLSSYIMSFVTDIIVLLYEITTRLDCFDPGDTANSLFIIFY